MESKFFTVLSLFFCVFLVHSTPVEDTTVKQILQSTPPANESSIISQKKEHIAGPEIQLNKANGTKQETPISYSTAESPIHSQASGHEAVTGDIATSITTGKAGKANETVTSPSTVNPTHASTIIHDETKKTTELTSTTKSNVSTDSPSIVTSTSTPISVTTVPPTTTSHAPVAGEVRNDRQFHSASFIGGIVTALGSIGIGFVAYKFYRARTDRNYRNL